MQSHGARILPSTHIYIFIWSVFFSWASFFTELQLNRSWKPPITYPNSTFQHMFPPSGLDGTREKLYRISNKIGLKQRSTQNSNQQSRLKNLYNQPTSKSVRPRMAGVFVKTFFFYLKRLKRTWHYGSVKWVLARGVELWRFRGFSFPKFFWINENFHLIPFP